MLVPSRQYRNGIESCRMQLNGAAEQTLEKPQCPLMSIRPPEPAKSNARRNAIHARSVAGVAFRLARPAAVSGWRNLISGHGVVTIIVTAMPTNEVTPTRISDEPRGTKRDPHAKRGADRISSRTARR